ncbi:MAG: HDIG domain-containing protein, partial [Muribaculaceae bacterium]|nr:HDIG domain-containing protein [Muribaculaceae bacterium]
MKQTQPSKGLSQYWRQIVITAVAIVVIVYFYPHAKFDRPEFHVGKPWQHETLRAGFEMTKTRDEAKVRHDLDSLNEVFVKVYKYVPTDANRAALAVLSQIDVARKIDSTVSYNPLYFMQFKNKVKDEIIDAYTTGSRLVLAEDKGELPDQIRIAETKKIFNTYNQGTFTSVGEIKRRLYNIDTELANHRHLLDAAKLDRLLVPTAICDTAATDSLLAIASLQFTGDLGTFQVGETIIERGRPVTAQDSVNIANYLDLAEKSGSADSQSGLLTWTGQALFVLLIMGILVTYLILYEPSTWRSAKDFGFIVGLVTVMFLIVAIVSSILTLGLYVVPIAIVPILLLVFYNGRMGLWTGIVLALLCSGISNSAFQYIFLQIVACGVAVISLRDLTQRSQLLKTSALVFAGITLAYISVRLMTVGTLDEIRLRMIGVLAVYAVLTSLTYVLMFGIERLFGFVSNVTLVEISDVNAPLLKALSDECPGTFQHVVAVSNLASDAAGRIGANALLTRAGAMYHDIGKLSNPMFFTENQHGVNPHDGLSPLKSAEIIINHVTDGLRRAEKAGLPPVLRDFISEHHGAGQAKYFYYTYCKEHPDEKVDPKPFTYPGPNPRTRETSVLMMADAVEAASRSLREHTPKAISDLVNKIIDGQIADGLHADSPLSFHDVKTIKESFIKRLMTMYHSRISYPDDPNKGKNKPENTPDENEQK